MLDLLFAGERKEERAESTFSKVNQSLTDSCLVKSFVFTVIIKFIYHRKMWWFLFPVCRFASIIRIGSHFNFVSAMLIWIWISFYWILYAFYPLDYVGVYRVTFLMNIILLPSTLILMSHCMPGYKQQILRWSRCPLAP